jgi:hypothetical protein
MFLAAAPAVAAPAPDPPPSALTPDPAPEAVKRPSASAPQPRVRVLSPPAAAPAHAARPPVHVHATAQRPKAKQQPQVAKLQGVVRDSAPMPRGPEPPAADVFERGRLALAGLALFVVALGGAVVLLTTRRALTGAEA